MPCRYRSFRSSSSSTGRALSFAISVSALFPESFGQRLEPLGESRRGFLSLLDFVLAAPLGPALLDLRQARPQKGQECGVALVILLDTLAITGRDIGLVVLVEKVGFDLTRQVLGVQAAVVDLVQYVLVEQASAREHDDAVEVPGVFAVQLLGQDVPSRSSRPHSSPRARGRSDSEAVPVPELWGLRTCLARSRRRSREIARWEGRRGRQS